MNWLRSVAEWLLNIDNLTFLMAAVGFLYSIYDLFATWIKSREHYKIAVIDYAVRGNNVMQFLMCITNKSQSPLAISSVQVFDTPCELTPKAIRGHPDQWNFLHTASFPIGVEGHGCSYVFLEFVGQGIGHNPVAPGTAVTFRIHSTEKRARKTVTLGEKSHYLHNRE